MTQPNITTLPIPNPVDPGETICLQITVPKSRDHVSALYGAIYTLTTWNAWDSDDAHSGKQLAALWKKALNTLQTCEGTPVLGGLLEDLEMPLRVDCDCNVFATCCDGTEKQILTKDQVLKLIAPQQVPGAPQPQPGGGCQAYPGTVDYGKRYLVPTVVNTGDVLTLSEAQGATRSSSMVFWLCPDGHTYFVNDCVGSISFDATNPVPSAPSGSPIAWINGTAYGLSSPLTVPSATTNAQVEIGLNYPSGTSGEGNIAFFIQVCNNAATTWSHVIDLTLNQGGFVNDPVDGCSGAMGGTWTPGSGWNTGLCEGGGSSRNALFIKWPFGGTVHFTAAQITFDTVLGSHTVNPAFFMQFDSIAPGGSDVPLETVTPSTGTNQFLTAPGAFDAIQLGVYFSPDATVSPNHADGSARLWQMAVSGTGTDPFAGFP